MIPNQIEKPKNIKPLVITIIVSVICPFKPRIQP